MWKNKYIAGLQITIIIVIIVFDSSQHFDRDRIQIKREHRSAQRNWNLFYGQKYVFQDSSIKYREDFEDLSEVIKPNSVMLADISTSYYVSAQLPLFIKNSHRHHRGYNSWIWNDFVDSSALCYLDLAPRRELFSTFIMDQRREEQQKNTFRFRYLFVNKDQVNLNMRNDCMSQTRTAFINHIDEFANLVFDGNYFMVYELKE